MAGAGRCGNRSETRHPTRVQPVMKFALVVVCFCVGAGSFPTAPRRGIIYSTKRDMPPNIHYIAKIEERGGNAGDETVKLSCAHTRKGVDPGTNKADGSDCLRTSGIITAPSRSNDDDCIGHNRRKDLNGLCRKIWD